MLSRDPGVHLRDLKSTPPIEDAGNANACIECGFCEPVCPSRDVTTTPRQRIVVRREMARQVPGSPVQRALVEQYAYDGEQTCAADGSCRLACPVAIDTGKLIKDLRLREHAPRAERRMLHAAQRWAAVERAARAGLAAGRILGDRPMAGFTRLARRLLGADSVPAWVAPMPPPAPRRLPATAREGAAAVYLPSCVNRMMGPPDGRAWLVQALVDVSARAGLPVWIPEDAAGHCCAMPWSSKGFRDGHEHMARRLASSLRRWTGGGALPVVIDASSCTHGVQELAGLDGVDLEGVEVLDAVSWAQRLLPGLEITGRAASVTLHPTCSSRHLGLAAGLEELARALADDVHVPLTATCCGMAGDRGLLHPELTASATRDEAERGPPSRLRGARLGKPHLRAGARAGDAAALRVDRHAARARDAALSGAAQAVRSASVGASRDARSAG